MKTYAVHRAQTAPALRGEWDSPAWQRAETADIATFLPRSSAHRPCTRVRLLYNDDGIFGLFKVEDRYVRSVHTRFQDSVCRDSCVEFFFTPHPAADEAQAGYFNFECNCGGTFLCHYMTAPSRKHPEAARQVTALTEADAEAIRVFHSMPAVVEPEWDRPTTWTLEFFIPYRVLEQYTGPLDVRTGPQWEGNFYKCADATSHPHWACWSAVDRHSFHRPNCFGRLLFQ